MDSSAGLKRLAATKQELLISIEYACDEGFQASGSVKSQDLDWEEIKD